MAKNNNAKESKKELVQEKYIQFQIIAEQMKQVQQQLQLFDEQLIELSAVIQSLDDFKKLKKETGILVPVNNGIFAEGKIENIDELMVNVGSNVVVKKDVESTKAMLQQRSEELNRQREQIVIGLQALAQRARELEKEILELVK